MTSVIPPAEYRRRSMELCGFLGFSPSNVVRVELHSDWVVVEEVLRQAN